MARKYVRTADNPPGRPRAFTRESVERALDLHVPGRWTQTHAPLDLSVSGHKKQAAAYDVDTAIGTLRLRTLREAYAFVVGAAEANRQHREEAP